MNKFFCIICIFALLLPITPHAEDKRAAITSECSLIASFGEDYAKERQNNPDKAKAYDNALAKFVSDFNIKNNQQITKTTKAYTIFIEQMLGYRPHTMGLYTLAQCLSIHADKRLPVERPEGVEMVKRVLASCDPLTGNEEQKTCMLDELAPLLEEKPITFELFQ